MFSMCMKIGTVPKLGSGVGNGGMGVETTTGACDVSVNDSMVAEKPFLCWIRSAVKRI